MQLFHSSSYSINRNAQLLRQVSLGGLVMGDKFMERWVEEADGGGKTFQGFENSSEVGALGGQEFGECFAPLIRIFGQNHLAHVIDSISLKEHVFRATKPDPLRAKSNCVADLVGLVGIGTDIHGAALICPLHELGKDAVDGALGRSKIFVD